MHAATVRAVEGVAELTGYRDHDLILISLARSLVQVVAIETVDIYATTGPTDNGLRFVTHVDGAHSSQTEPPGWSGDEAFRAAVLQCSASGAEIQLPSQGGGAGRRLVPVLSYKDYVEAVLVFPGQGLSAPQQTLYNAFLQIYLNYLSLIEENQRDKLTGLLNRKTFDEYVDGLIGHAPESSDDPEPDGSRRQPAAQGTHWIAICDLDHFKAVNDRYGHLFGDEVLVLLSQQLRSSFRKGDRIFRFGGEEFVVVLRTRSAPEATLAVERFRANVESHPFPQIGGMTVSIGLAQLSPGLGGVEVLGRADQALYHAKENGRNRSCVWEDLTAQGLIPMPQATEEIAFF